MELYESYDFEEIQIRKNKSIHQLNKIVRGIVSIIQTIYGMSAESQRAIPKSFVNIWFDESMRFLDNIETKFRKYKSHLMNIR